MIPEVKTRRPFYGEAMALAQSAAFSETYRAGFDWLGYQIKQASNTPLLFDLGCGDGTWLAAARDMKIDGQGVDTSKYLAKIARQKGLTITVDAATPSRPPKGTTAVTAIGGVLAYKPASLTTCALNAARVLPKGGVFIFDLPGPTTAQSTVTAEGTGWSLTARSFISGRNLSRQITIVTENGPVEEVHYQHLYSPDEVTGILTGLGFLVEILPGYGPYIMQPGHYSVLARKK